MRYRRHPDGRAVTQEQVTPMNSIGLAPSRAETAPLLAEVIFPTDAHVRVHVGSDLLRDDAFNALLTDVVATAGTPERLERDIRQLGDELGFGVATRESVDALVVLVERVTGPFET